MGGGKSKQKQVPKKQEQEKRESNHRDTPHDLFQRTTPAAPAPPAAAAHAAAKAPPVASNRAGIDVRVTALDLTVLGNELTCMAVDADGYRFVCTKSALYLISPTGWHALLAGDKSKTGFKDGEGPEARFNNLCGIALDLDGNVLLADTGNHRLRKVTRTGDKCINVKTSDGDKFLEFMWAKFGSHSPIVHVAAVLCDPEFVDQDLRNTEQLSQKVAVAKSGGPSFVKKAQRAQKAGALALIVINTDNNPMVSPLDGGHDNTPMTPNRLRLPPLDEDDSTSPVTIPVLVVESDAGAWLLQEGSHITVVGRTSAVTTVAGSEEWGYADGVGATAQFHSPWGIVVDASGTIFVADSDNHCLRKVAPGDGAVSTLAGKGGQAGYVEGQGASARFNGPRGLALDADNNLVVADRGNHCIRRITTDNGRVTMVAGRAEHAGFADDDTGHHIALFNHPCGIAVDGDNILLVADTANHRIRMIVTGGQVTTLFDIGEAVYLPANRTRRESHPFNLALDQHGRLLVFENENRGWVLEMEASLVSARKGSVAVNQTLSDALTPVPNRGGQGVARIAALDLTVLGNGDITCMTIDKDGYRFVCTKSVLYLITPTGWHALLAGHKSEKGLKNGHGPEARFNYPRGIALDVAGNVLLADTDNHVLREVTHTGTVTTVAGSGEKDYADGVGTAARFHRPWGIVVDASGTIFVADSNNHCLRKVAPVGGAVSTLAGKGGMEGFVGNQGASAQHVSGGRQRAARFRRPRGLSLDVHSNLIVADSGNHCIRRVATDDGRVTTVAGRPEHEGHADGEATDALFHFPRGVAVDGNNNVLVADTNNNRIRMIAGSGGKVTTFMGNGQEESRHFNQPRNLMFDQRGRLLVLEKENKGLLRAVDALLWAKDNLAVDAGRHALDAFSCLRCLGQAFALVKDKRTELTSHKTGLQAHVKAFEKLIEMLRHHDANNGKLEVEVERVEQTVKLQREELGIIQKEIQEEVARCLEDGATNTGWQGQNVIRQVQQVHAVASLAALPEGVQTKVRNRNLKCAKHIEDLRSWRESLLQATIQASKLTVSMKDAIAIKSKLDLDETIKSKREQEREKRLESVLAAARASVQEYNAEHAASGVERGLMGARLHLHPTMPQESEVIPSVVRSYDDWVSTIQGNSHVKRSDDAMLALQNKFGESIGKVLAPEQADSHEDTGLKQAFKAAGSAIAEEHEHQRKDALGFFPCTALLQAGRQLLEVWKTESATIRQGVEVCGMLEADLKEHEECLDSAGRLSKEKDALVAELQAAGVSYNKKIAALEALSAVVKLGDAVLIQHVAQGFELQDVPAHKLMCKLRQDVKEASGRLTAAIQKLTGQSLQHFPEVILFVGKGLPPELGRLWRPPRSLDSFDGHKEESETRHKIYQVRDGDTLFAIKAYDLKQSDLHTCFKEAAIVYRHRHLNIVEIKALFLDKDQEKNTFYMQMPWYTHGSVDKWVCGGMRPGWVKVRSVLLDALIGLAHLHENGILHGDVKPPNILVDDRERGRLGDFDISIDTKERTSAGTSRTRTMCAPALGMTRDFAAPELKSFNQATKHTDMFAYGKTVLCLQEHCEPGAQEAFHSKARGQTAALVKDLTLDDPKRPAAKHVIDQSPFFAILNDASSRDSKVCLLCEQNGDEFNKDPDAGIECSEGHFNCRSCVANLVQALLKVENKGKHALLKGEVKCFKCPMECNASGFDARDLARQLPVDDFRAYLKGKVEILEADLKAKLEEESRKQMVEELARLKALDELERRVLLARKHIEEEIMQLKCPRQSCRRAFFDFEGCFAISCSSCTCKFCGWCLQDCGDHDAHPHVRQCAKVPRGVDALFPSMPTVPTVAQVFEKTHTERCRESIKSYIDNKVDADIREKVRQHVQKIDSGLL